jgi:hypothetical protein
VLEPPAKVASPFLSFFIFFVLTGGIRIALQATHEAHPHTPRIYFFGWGSHCLPADRASTSVVKSRNRTGQYGILRGPLQFLAEKCQDSIDRR